MSTDLAMGLFAQFLWKAVVLSAPLLLTVLLVGLTISILQVVTQIQEMSLTFIPKLAASVMVLAFAGSWMLGSLVNYSRDLLQGIPHLF